MTWFQFFSANMCYARKQTEGKRENVKFITKSPSHFTKNQFEITKETKNRSQTSLSICKHMKIYKVDWDIFSSFPLCLSLFLFFSAQKVQLTQFFPFSGHWLFLLLLTKLLTSKAPSFFPLFLSFFLSFSLSLFLFNLLPLRWEIKELYQKREDSLWLQKVAERLRRNWLKLYYRGARRQTDRNRQTDTTLPTAEAISIWLSNCPSGLITRSSQPDGSFLSM